MVLGGETGFGGSSCQLLLFLIRVVGRVEGYIWRYTGHDRYSGRNRGLVGGVQVTNICVGGVGQQDVTITLVGTMFFVGRKGGKEDGGHCGVASDGRYYRRAIGALAKTVLLVVSGVHLGYEDYSLLGDSRGPIRVGTSGRPPGVTRVGCRYGGTGGVSRIGAGRRVLFTPFAGAGKNGGRTPGQDVTSRDLGGYGLNAITNIAMIGQPYGCVTMYQFGRASPTYGDGGPGMFVLYGNFGQVCGTSLGYIHFYLGSFFLYIYVGGSN